MQEQQTIVAEVVDNDNVVSTLADPVALSEEQQISVLQVELAELKDALLRARADLENQRRRGQEEVVAAHKYALTKFAAELVSVKDYLEMALLDQSGQIDTLKMGVDMTLKQLVTAFDKAQIRDIDPQVGEKLDPHQHQSMGAEDSDLEPNTILRVMQKGYQIFDRVLRPAMVVVAKARA